MVVVDVVATDNKDVPLKDLKADDFTVQDEGQETVGTLNAPVTIPPPAQAGQAQPTDKKP